MNLKKLFIKHCEINQFEINVDQLKIIDDLKDFYEDNFKQSYFRRSSGNSR